MPSTRVTRNGGKTVAALIFTRMPLLKDSSSLKKSFQQFHPSAHSLNVCDEALRKTHLRERTEPLRLCSVPPGPDPRANSPGHTPQTYLPERAAVPRCPGPEFEGRQSAGECDNFGGLIPGEPYVTGTDRWKCRGPAPDSPTLRRWPPKKRNRKPSLALCY